MCIEYNNTHNTLLLWFLSLSFVDPFFLMSRLHSHNHDSDEGVTEAYCSSLLRDHLKHDYSMPQECRSFASIREAMKNKKEEVNPFAGMAGGQALAAQSARAGGRLNQAQIMRRMSSRARPKDKSWF